MIRYADILQAKAKQLSKKYCVESVHSYKDYAHLVNSGEIDAVYIALPNSMHRDYSVEASNAGVHVQQLSGLQHARIFDVVGRGDVLPVVTLSLTVGETLHTRAGRYWLLVETSYTGASTVPVRGA